MSKQIDDAIALLSASGYYVGLRKPQGPHPLAEKIASLRAAGLSFEKIGKTMDLSGSRVSQIYHHSHPVTKIKLTTEQVAARDKEIAVDFRKGAKVSVLAKQHGLTRATIYSIVRWRTRHMDLSDV